MADYIEKQNTFFQDVALLLARLVLAAIFLFAAWAKLSFWSASPSPEMSSGMLTLIKFLSIVEPLGAIAVLFGFLTRWAAAGLGVIMVGAILLLYFTMHAVFFTSPQAIGLDYNFLILSLNIVLMTFGGGKWSIDKMLKGK